MQKVSIITAVKNNAGLIEDALHSVSAQTYAAIEHIVVDGGSTDGTLAALERHRGKIARLITGPDQGIYDALNKGIAAATGEIIGLLHADDIYGDENVIETVVQRMTADGVDSCYGDLLYVNRRDARRVIRYWKAGAYREGLFKHGWMPPHPTFFVRKEVYERCGAFNRNFNIAADYELMLRFLEKCRISTVYVPRVLVKMRTGGVSNKSLGNVLVKTSEDYRAWSANALPRKWYTIPLKNFSKLPQFFRRYGGSPV